MSKKPRKKQKKTRQNQEKPRRNQEKPRKNKENHITSPVISSWTDMRQHGSQHAPKCFTGLGIFHGSVKEIIGKS